MAKEVELPNGDVAEFPDDMPDEAIAEVLRRQFSEPAQDSAPAPLMRDAPPTPAPPTLAERGEAALRGVTSGFYGLGDYAAASGDFYGLGIKALVDQRPGEAEAARRFLREKGIRGSLERVRARRRDLERRAPLPSAAGNIAGGVGSGVGVLRALGARGAAVVPRALQFQAAQPAANTARALIGGGTAAGVTEANLGGDPTDIAVASGVGVVAAPVAGALARFGGAGINALRTLFDRNADEGLRRFAEAATRSGAIPSPSELPGRVQEYRDLVGADPSLTQVIGGQGGREVADITRQSADARQLLRESAGERAAASQDELSRAIAGDRPKVSPAELEAIRDEQMTAVMEPIRRRAVRLTPDEAATIVTEDTRGYITPSVRRQLLAIADGEATSITLGDADILRRVLNRAAQSGERPAAAEGADVIREAATRSVPAYGNILDVYGQQSRFIEGAVEGGRIRNAPQTGFEQAAARADESTFGGMRTGARTALSDAAAESPQAAVRVAQDLAESTGLQSRIAALDPAEAERLRRLGQVSTRAQEGVTESARQSIPTTGELEEDVSSLLSDIAFAGAGRLSLPARVNQLSRLFSRLRVPPTASRRLAEAMTSTDPAEVQEAIDILIRYGVEPRMVQRIAQAASRAAARTTGPALTLEEDDAQR